MADDIYDQVTAHIREVVRLVHSAKGKGKTLPKLNDRIAETSKFALQSILDVLYTLTL